MIVCDSIAAMELPWDRTVVSIGNFDGVHVGHAELIRRLRAMADRLGVHALVFTFDPHPSVVLQANRTSVPLTWPERKDRLMRTLGADDVLFFHADPSFFAIDAESFFREVLVRRLKVRGMVEGPDFCFGRDRSGDVARLKELAAPAGIDIEIVPKVQIDGSDVSSSLIRALVERGEIDEANRRLAARYRIAGTVESGAGRGASIGFPTANLEGVVNLVPGPGVYAARTFGLDDVYASAVHIGPNPTFDDNRLKVEVHLIGWHGSLNGRRLEVEFVRRLRDVVRFESADQLAAQLRKDVAAAAASVRDLPLEEIPTSNHP